MSRRNRPLRAWLYGLRADEYEFMSEAQLAEELRELRHARLQKLALKYLEGIAEDQQRSRDLEEAWLEGFLSGINRIEHSKRKRELARITKLVEHDKNQQLLQRIRNTRRQNRWPR